KTEGLGRENRCGGLAPLPPFSLASAVRADAVMVGDTSVGRSRRLLTFRLDGDQRRRLKARLAGEGRTMSEVVILGLQNYVGHGTRRSGPGSGSRAPEPEAALGPPAGPELDAAPGAPGAPEPDAAA